MTIKRAAETANTPARLVLVVEDDPDIGNFLELLFQDEGYQVRRVLRGSEALRLLHSSPPDLITLDLDLPDVPGEEVLQRLTEDSRLRRIPVVVVSACADYLRPTPQVVRVINKPFDLQDLLWTTERALAS